MTNNISILPSTFERLSQHPNIVGCKLSHFDLQDHTLIANSPKIDHDKFATFTGLGQQLLPALSVGCAGAIDGLAAFFPRTVVLIYNLYQSNPSNLKSMRETQYKVSAGEKIITKWGPIGVKEACSRIMGFGDSDGARLPAKGGFGDAEWENWKDVMAKLRETEDSLPEFGTQ